MANFKQHIIVYGETLQSIAQDELGDMSQWYSIAQLNNLKYPYIADTVVQKNANPNNLVTIGDTILISIPDTVRQTDLISSLATMPTYDQDEIIALALGKDLDILPLMDSTTPAPGLSGQALEMKGDHNGSISILRGIDNLKQSIYIRLITPQGSYIGHPDYGSRLDMYIGMKNTEENAQIIDLEIERSIRTDSRVTNVIFNGHTITNNSYTGSFSVFTLNMGQAFQFVVSARNNGPVVLLDNFNSNLA